MDAALTTSLGFVPLWPLIGATILALLGPYLGRSLSIKIALLAALGAFVTTVVAVGEFVAAGEPLEQPLWTWIAAGRYQIDFVFGLDALSATLLLVVTGVGFIIHVFSVGYMEEDPGSTRFFAYLNLFIVAMSVLVLGRSLPIMFVGWEGVGLASYLLIGFWFTDEEKAAAGKKAFITNRIGDFGFLLGMFVLFGLLGTTDFVEMRSLVESIPNPDVVLASDTLFAGMSVRAVVTIACLLLFVGATGKSAQIPLYVWLPDAMAGPTPVSALIHAATMVTAGVYMVARLFFLFDLAPDAQDLVAWIGAITALFAATIGLAQNDIKKVLAYSTVSQLGYMFLAVGLGAYSAAMFHLVTHAFFKACLFLGSGTVIHALHGEQDMRRMGGLRKELPLVFWTFLVSTLALAGVAPFAGFFSKDEILAIAFQENQLLWVFGFLGAGLTALYMSRLFCLTFLGEARNADAHGHHGHAHLHKPGWSMKFPLLILGVLAVVAGGLNLPAVLVGDRMAGWLSHFLQPATGEGTHVHLAHHTELMLMVASIAWAVLGLTVGYLIYRKGPSSFTAKLRSGALFGGVRQALANKWWIDELYQTVVIRPIRTVASFCSSFVDPWIIDGLGVRGTGFFFVGAGRVLSRLHTGNVQSYASVLVMGMTVFVLWLLL
jgi:NADH-quinone oxidoreductase subunit L